MDTNPQRIESLLELKLKGIKKVGIDAMCFIYQFQAHPLFGPPVSFLFSRMEERKL